MSLWNFYYVCDKCGNLEPYEDEISAEDGWDCDVCGSNRVWEFTRKDAAEHHSARIKNGKGSGLFRKVP